MSRHRGQTLDLDRTGQLEFGVPISAARAVLVAVTLQDGDPTTTRLGVVVPSNLACADAPSRPPSMGSAVFWRHRAKGRCEVFGREPPDLELVLNQGKRVIVEQGSSKKPQRTPNAFAFKVSEVTWHALCHR